MQKIKNFCFLGLILVVVMSCNSKNKDDHSAQNEGESTYYTCSMDPQIKVDKPGKCPICKMDLTPMKKDNSASNEITLSEQQIKLGNITTQNIAESKNSVAENYTGVLTINQEEIKTVSARASGRLEKVYFKTTGDYVVKNQAIYQLYSEEIAVAKQDYFLAYKQLAMPGDFGKNAKNMLQSAKQKLLFYGLSNTQIDRLKNSNESSPYTTFYSTYSGYVSEVAATEGSYVMEGAPIIKLADLSTLWLETQVNVSYAKSLKIGQKAVVKFTDFPEKELQAKISFINPEINPDTRLLLIRMEIINPNVLLKPGMQAVARLSQSNRKGRYLPTDAVIRDENATYIWIEKSPGLFANVMVETGAEANGMIEIKSDLDPTKKVVVTGAYAINSEFIFRKGSDPMAGMKM
jgi:Cu(I)/Ag(I) efflux system membrane fusion protein